MRRLEHIRAFYQSILDQYQTYRDGRLDSYLTNGCSIAAIRYFLLRQMEALKIPFQSIRSNIPNRIPYYPIHELRTSLEVLESFYNRMAPHEWGWSIRKKIQDTYAWDVREIQTYFDQQAQYYQDIWFSISLVYPDALARLCPQKRFAKIHTLLEGDLSALYQRAYKVRDYDSIFVLDAFLMALVALLYLEELETRKEVQLEPSVLSTIVTNAVNELQLFGPQIDHLHPTILEGKNQVAEQISERVWNLPWLRGEERNYIDQTPEGFNPTKQNLEWIQLYERKLI